MSQIYKTVNLKRGDALLYEGYCVRVCVVEKDCARVVNSGGEVNIVPNPLDEHYFSLLGGAIAPLENLLETFRAWKEDYVKPITEHERNKIDMPSKKLTETKTTTRKPLPRGGLAAEAIRAKSAGGSGSENKQDADAAKAAADAEAKEAKATAKAEAAAKKLADKEAAAKARAEKKVAAAAAKAEKKAKTGTKRAQIFGTSVVRVLKAAGKAGSNFEQAKAFLAKQGVNFSEATTKAALRIGKNEAGVDMADLTPAQIKEIGL